MPGGAARGRLGDAAGAAGQLRQRAVRRVAGEGGDGVAEEGADVDVVAVGADDDHVGRDAGARPTAQPGSRQPGDAAGERRRQLAQRAGLRVAGEAGDRVAGARGRVDVAAVGADRDRVRFVEADRVAQPSAPLAAMQPAVSLGLGEDAGLRSRVKIAIASLPRGGDVDVAAVGADRDRPRAHERARALQRPRPGAAAGLGGAVDQAAAPAGELGQRPRLRLRESTGREPKRRSEQSSGNHECARPSRSHGANLCSPTDAPPQPPAKRPPETERMCECPNPAAPANAKNPRTSDG